MINTFYERKRYLPKCWIARIQRYWDRKRIPTNIPESSSSFSYVDTQEEKAAVIDMEAKLNTEESIISPDVIPENNAVGAYLGTYDVVGTAGEKTLLSPNKLPDTNTGACAYHYDVESDTWTKVEDVEVIDGYVWGTLDSFSPIAVFAFRRDSYYDTTQTGGLAGNVYVCNGIKTKIYTDEDGKIIAESAYGKKTELTETDFVVGGSYDGTEIDSTEITVIGAKLKTIIGGSFLFEGTEANKNKCSSVKITVLDSDIYGVYAGGIWCSIDKAEITVKNSKVSGVIGAQICYLNKKCSNETLEESAKRLASNQWIKDVNINVSDTEVYVVYAGGNNGYCYTKNAVISCDNVKAEYFSVGQSNGTIDNSVGYINNCEIKYLSTNNRGIYGDGNVVVKNSVVENGYVFSDPTDATSTADVIGKVSYDIDANTTIKNFCVGNVNAVEVVDEETAKKYIGRIVIDRDAKITYTRNADKILKNIAEIR